MLSPQEIRAKGIIIKPSKVTDTEKYSCRTKLLMTPAMGSSLTGCEVVYCEPGQTFNVHLHPVAEDVIEVFKGKGEAFLGDFWYEVGEGDVIYAPENVRHGIRNPASNKDTLVCYSWQVPYLSDLEALPGARDVVFDKLERQVVTRENRGKFDTHIPYTGFIGYIDRGALFTDYGAPMRFIVWPGMGSRKVSFHRAKHPPGFEFKTHVHPDAEDTVLAFRGNGQGYLVDKWFDMDEGDVLHAPIGVKHGTRNHRTTGVDFICTGAAAPPQQDLYTLAGYV